VEEAKVRERGKKGEIEMEWGGMGKRERGSENEKIEAQTFL
jgi:hypothetical protein